MMIDQLEMVLQKEIAPGIFEMMLQGESVTAMTEPGQFVHIKVGEGISPLLRRPISICDVDPTEKRLTIIYRVEGKGTLQLSQKKHGDTVDVLGPLGRGFPVNKLQKGETALLVGGGVGIPPLYYLGKRLTEKGVHIKTILGFRTAEDIFLEKAFRELGDMTVTTEDGSKGVKGFVTDAMKDMAGEYDTYYTCGPVPMLNVVQTQAVTDGFISLEERMGCGVGACLACVCQVSEDHVNDGRRYRKVCSDGPVFKAGEVVLT